MAVAREFIPFSVACAARSPPRCRRLPSGSRGRRPRFVKNAWGRGPQARRWARPWCMLPRNPAPRDGRSDPSSRRSPHTDVVDRRAIDVGDHVWSPHACRGFAADRGRRPSTHRRLRGAPCLERAPRRGRSRASCADPRLGSPLARQLRRVRSAHAASQAWASRGVIASRSSPASSSHSAADSPASGAAAATGAAKRSSWGRAPPT